MPRISSAKRYCFTLNNYTEDEFQGIKNSVEALGEYGVIGEESGELGTPHLQGFVCFRKRVSFQTCKDRLNSRCHVEVARGSPRQNREYCIKGGKYWEHGECPSGGASNGRSTRDEVAREFVGAMADGGSGMDGFASEFPGAYYFSRHQLLRNFLGHQRAVERPDVFVEWYYGPPGVGKSRKAHEKLPCAYIKEPRTKWWNGYMLEKDVIIDDFGPNGIDINHLLRWFDRYKCYVEVKGDMVPLLACTFIVTSNFHPEKIFKWGDEVNPQLPALLRRIVLVEFV